MCIGDWLSCCVSMLLLQPWLMSTHSYMYEWWALVLNGQSMHGLSLPAIITSSRRGGGMRGKELTQFECLWVSVCWIMDCCEVSESMKFLFINLQSMLRLSENRWIRPISRPVHQPIESRTCCLFEMLTDFLLWWHLQLSCSGTCSWWLPVTSGI